MHRKSIRINWYGRYRAKTKDEVQEQSQSKPKDEFQKPGVTTIMVKKLFSGKNITSGLKVPEKSKLEEKIWYRLFRVLFFIAFIMIVLVSIGVIYVYYDDKTSCYSSFSDCMDETEAFFKAIFVGILCFYVVFIILNAIRLTFYYIVYGKKK